MAGGKSGNLTVLAKIWTDEEKKTRAWRTLAIGWGIAIFTIFLPLVHFILVPLFLIGAPIVAGKMKKQEGQIEGVEGSCPFCGERLDCTLKINLLFPLRVPCQKCFEVVSMERS